MASALADRGADAIGVPAVGLHGGGEVGIAGLDDAECIAHCAAAPPL